MTDDTPGLNRIERVLPVMIAAVAGVSILAVLAVLIAQAAGVREFDGGWLLVTPLPTVGLPIAFVLIVVYLVLTTIRRRRAANGDGQ